MQNQGEILNQLHLAFIELLEKSGFDSELNFSLVNKIGSEAISKLNLDLEESEKDELISRLNDKVLGFGPITDLLNDPTVAEVMVNGTRSLYVEKDGRLISLPNKFNNDEEVLQVINKMVSPVGRRIDTSSPLVDARLPDGSRVNAVIAPLSLTGPTITIRRFPKNPPTLEGLVEKGTMSPAMAEFLRAAISSKHNIIVSGGTGSGKTTTLNALAGLIPDQERLITIEDSAEMKIDHPHIVSLESRTSNLEGKGEISVRQLLKNALRMRPDRIIVGEIRGGEALDMLQAMNTGHPGSLTTVHANNPLEALHRIETMTLMADVELPHSAIREQLNGAINLITQQMRLPDGSRKMVSVCSLEPKQDGSFKLIELFKYDFKTGVFSSTGLMPSTMQLFEDYQIPFDNSWLI